MSALWWPIIGLAVGMVLMIVALIRCHSSLEDHRYWRRFFERNMRCAIDEADRVRSEKYQMAKRLDRAEQRLSELTWKTYGDYASGAKPVAYKGKDLR